LEEYVAHPPVPKKVVDPSGQVVFTNKDVQEGQKILQTLLEVGADQNSTIVFPLPLDMLEPFLKKGTADG
jgi:nitric oxide reductase large subunit